MEVDEQTLECMKKLDKFNETGCTKNHKFCKHEPKILIKSNVEQYLEWCKTR